MRTKSAYVFIMVAAERELSQWTPLELQAGPLMMEFNPSLYSQGRPRLGEQTEEGAETSQPIRGKARTGAPCPSSRSGALPSESNRVGSTSLRGLEEAQHKGAFPCVWFSF